MQVLKKRTAHLIGMLLCTQALVELPVKAQNYYFDYDSASGLTPSGENIVSWDLSSPHWQTVTSPGTNAPVIFGSGESAFFRTGGINRLNVNGAVTAANIAQSVSGTTTYIGGTGTLSIVGDTIENASAGVLQFERGLTLVLQSTARDWIASDGEIIVNADITGAAGTLSLSGGERIVLSGANSYTGTTIIAGLVEAGSTTAFGDSFIRLNSGDLVYRRGLTQDFSSQFTAVDSVLGTNTIDTNGNNITWGGSLTGSGTLTKTGDGRLSLTGDNSAYGGAIVVEQGILSTTQASGLGTSTSAADGLEVKEGATFDYSGATDAVNERIILAGHGVGNLGAIMNNTGGGRRTNQVTLAGHTTISANARWDFDAVFNANGFSITKIGTDQTPFEGSSQNIGNIYVKQGTLNFTGGSDMGYFDSLTFGNTAYVNQNAGLLFWSKGNDAKRITLKGGYLQRNSSPTGAVNQTLTVTGGLELAAGSSDIKHGNSQLIFALGEINRNIGATLNIQHTSGIEFGPTTGNPAMATTTSANVNGIIGGYLTYGGNTWAVNSEAVQVGSTTNVIVGLDAADYSTDDFSGAGEKNVNVTTSASTPAGFNVNTLRFNTAAPVTLTLAGDNIISSGGVLVTSAVGANTVNITGGGTLRGAASGDLIIHQNNTSGVLNIDAIIADNGGSTALTVSGPGRVNLRKVNTYTGDTYINASAGNGGSAVLDVNNISTTGNDNLGSTSNDLYMNFGTLRYTNSTTSAETNRDVTLLSGGGIFDVTTSGITLRLSGVITGEDLATDEGHFAGEGNLTKNGNGILEISNAANDYTGTTTVNAGILRMIGSGKLGADHGRLTVNGSGALELNGTNQAVGLLMGNGGVIRNGAATDSVLSIGNDDATFVAGGTGWGTGSGYAGSIQDGGSGSVSLEKNGVGYQILSGNSTYSGTTMIHAGTLQVGAGTSGTSSSGASTGSGLHTVAAGATLAGNGTVGGSVVLESGALLSIGNFGQTVGQTLTINGGLIADGNIGFDVLSHAGTVTSADMLRFSAPGAVEFNGDLIVNNMLVTSWAAGEKIKLIDWGAVSVNERSLDGNLDISALDTASGAYWDTRRFLLDGTIIAMEDRDAFLWDSNTGSGGAQDGAGTWNTSNTNWINTGTNANASFTTGSDVFFGANSGAAGIVTIDNPGGVQVRDITFQQAGSDYYTIAGSGANGVLTLENDSMVTTAHGLEDDIGTTISASIAGQGWVKAGAGRLILSGANTFTGDLSVLQGVLDVRNATALGTTAGKTIVGAGATLTLRGGLTISESLELSGSGVNNSGALRNQAGNNTFSGAIALLADTQVTSRTDTLSLTGVISGPGGITITGEDSLAIVRFAGNGSNTYAGDTNINSGILLLQKNQFVNAIGSNTTINIGDGLGSSRDILRLGQREQISNTNTVLNFRGQGSGAGVFQLNGFDETVAAIQSVNGDGIIENGASSAASTLTVSNSGDYTFSGIMQNGGNGVLNFTKTNNGTLTLTGANTFTGAAFVDQGVLQLSGINGSIIGASSVKVLSGATLRLLNSASENNSNRLEGNVALAGGSVDFANTGGAASYSEALGVIELEGGANTISTSQAAVGQTATVTLDSISRNGGATLNFSGTDLGLDQRNQVIVNSISANPALQYDHGLLASWITVDNEFATYGSHGVRALTSSEYLTSAESTWTFRDNVKMTASTTLSGNRDINSLNIQQGESTVLDLGGQQLKVESGGVIVSGDFDSVISNGNLTAGTSENTDSDLVVHQNSTGRTLDITAQITDNGTGSVGLIKAGEGILQLSAANSFTGGVTLNKGSIILNHADAIQDGNDIAVQDGTLDLNGYSVSAGKLASDPDAKTGVITNTSATATTLTVGLNDESSLYAGRITNESGTGAISVVKQGLGTVELSGNSNYTGTTTVEEGTLRLGSSTALGVTGAASSTTVNAGATLLFAAEGVYNETINIQGRGADGRGALVLAQENVLRGGADQVRIMNVNFTGHTTININAKRVDFDGAFAANGNSITKFGTSEMTIEGSPTSNMGNLYIKQGSVTFGSGNSAMGLQDSAVYVNAGATLRFFNTGTQSKNLILRGGDWVRGGSNNSNTFTVTDGLKLEAGASSFSHSATQQVINLNAINRDVGATFNINNNSGPAVNTTTGNTNGIIGGFMTWSGNTWAVSGAGGTITGLSSYQTNTFAAGNNVDVSGAQGPAVGFDVNTLRFNNGSAATTLTLSGDNIISSGGILVTSAVGSQNATITGGSIAGSAGANGDLIIHQNNTGSAFTIESVIKNNGADATSLTKSGQGTLILTAQNIYSGRTFINGSPGSGAFGVLQVSNIQSSGADNLGDNSATNSLVFNKGTLRYTGASTSTDRDIQLLSGGAVIEVTDGSAELSLEGAITGEQLATDEGFYDGEGTLTKSGAGTLTLAGTEANTYTGNTNVDEGVLQLNKTGVNAVGGNVYLNSSGTLRLLQSDQIADSSVMYLNGTTTVFDMNGFSETLGGLAGTSIDAIIRNDAAPANLTVNVDAARTYKYVGKIDGDITLIKEGSGTQILANSSNGYYGTTQIEEGILQVGDGGTEGKLGYGDVTIAENAKLVMNTSADQSIEQTITGAGSFVQAGTGHTTFVDGFEHNFTGGTEVQAGTLVVNTTNMINMGPVVVVGGDLMGTGKVVGDVTIKDKGRLAIGDPGVPALAGSIFTVDGNVNIQRAAESLQPKLSFNIFGNEGVYNDANLAALPDLAAAQVYYNSIINNNGTVFSFYDTEADPGTSGFIYGSHDHLEISGSLSLDAGAIVEIKLADSYVFNAGDVFDFIDWTNANLEANGWSAYTDLILPDLNDATLVWDRSLFSEHGILTVVLVPEPGRAACLLLGLSTLVLRRRRRRQS